MLIGGVALGFVLGLLAGGSLSNLVAVRLRWVALLFGAVIVRFLTEAALNQDFGIAETLRLPLFGGAYVMLLVALWMNRRHPGLSIAFVGIFGNAIAIIVNAGHMPIWEPSLVGAGLTPSEIASPVHIVLAAPLDASFVLHAGPLGDVIPIPFPIIQNVASIGDIFLSVGLAFFLFATLVRAPGELEEDEAEAIARRLAGVTAAAPPRTGPLFGGPAGPAARSPIFEHTIVPGAGYAGSAAVLERPIVLGGSGAGISPPVLAPLEFNADATALAPPMTPLTLPGRLGGPSGPASPSGMAAGRASPATAMLATAAAPAISGPSAPAIPIPAPPAILERARRHPYVRLALNGSFSALWVGQTISLFGDRIHQVALAFLVLGVTNSPLAVGLVFGAATLPNLVLGPIAGTFVDRWDQKETMIVSDVLRAAAVILLPVVPFINIYLAYPLVFLVTSISLFFRPARTSVIPRIVREDELVTANSATWMAESIADTVGYGFAGVFVAFLGSALPMAFWIDAATYLASAVLIASMTVPPVRRTLASSRMSATSPADAAHDASAAGGGSGTSGGGIPKTGFREEFMSGWRFLRQEPVLLANTIQGTIGQFAIGVLLALTPIYARDVLQRGSLDAVAAYSYLETGIGVGNLIGGFVVGLIGARIAKGPLVIFGYAIWGGTVVALALTGNVGTAIGLTIGMGVANMVFVIPSQTLFQQRTPPELIGRVVGFRFSIVFGAMTFAMAISGLLAQVVGAAPVIAAFGAITIVAGLAGLLFRDVRRA